ncbi:hypothetical protein [Rhodospirillum sp. A1_3_36]|uniref:hypothetical protein n=1 Tax=Rhodospirillum sp. A1_3_36 TaxID=3391666 RepID=UPI0039A4A73F
MADPALAVTLYDYIKENGPTLGIDLVTLTATDVFTLAPIIGADKRIHRRAIETNYLRINGPGGDDQEIARVSPSFLRKFISYTLFSTDKTALNHAISKLEIKHREISAQKAQLAIDLCHNALNLSGLSPTPYVDVLLCGDTVYNMAHSSPRREYSTNILVHGSDVDLIILIRDEDEDLIPKIEREFLILKNYCLQDRNIGQEVDFIVKTKRRCLEQTKFETTKDKIASKILLESRLIHGEGSLYNAVQQHLETSGVKTKLEGLLETARREYKSLEEKIYNGEIAELDKTTKSVFFSTELNELGEFSRSRGAIHKLAP